MQEQKLLREQQLLFFCIIRPPWGKTMDTFEKEAFSMGNLTTKELAALEDQLGFEKMVCCKYQEAARQTTEAELKNCYTQLADQHRQNYDTLMGFLK